MSDHAFRASAHVPISCAVCGQEQRFHPDALLTTVQAALEKHGPGSDIGPMRALGWLRALVAEVERLREQVDIMLEANADLAALREQRCEWAEDADGNWDTSCDNKYCFFTGGPAENGMKFCCYCGSRLVERARREP